MDAEGLPPLRQVKLNETTTRISKFLTTFEEKTKELVWGDEDSPFRSTEQILDELDYETKFIDDMLEQRTIREKYPYTLRTDLKELREVELRRMDLMYEFLSWAKNEITDLMKTAKGDDIEIWRKVMQIIKNVSYPKSSTLSEKPRTDGKDGATVTPEGHSDGNIETPTTA